MRCRQGAQAAVEPPLARTAGAFRWIAAAIVLFAGAPLVCGKDDGSEEKVRGAVQKALPLLERAAAGSADQRQCFTCHSQALPVLAIVEARRRGFVVDNDNLQRQVAHTLAHLERGLEAYREGRGQGGKSDTAGYALWTLEAGDIQGDETIATVTDWLIDQQQPEGRWRTSSNRPPSEASAFTTTYVALRGLAAFGNDSQRAEIEQCSQRSLSWLKEANPEDTEDHVFRLLALNQARAEAGVLDSAAADLLQLQRADGGWAQKADMESDAYATGTALFALRTVDRLRHDDPHWQRAAEFLLAGQQADGSWYVKSRSDPFQTYYETGFPHGKDQFISTSATAWALLALLQAMPAAESSLIENLPDQ